MTSNEIHENILKSALVVFSEKGFYDATIKDIAKQAGCNAVTIFRHFEDKENLFKEVINKYHEFEFDADDLESKLSYINLHNDFRIMADHFFVCFYENIHKIRIYIYDTPNFDFVHKNAWFIPEELKDFVFNYINSVYMDKISPSHNALISEMFVSYILRTCLRMNVHDGIEENTKQISKEAKTIMSQSVDMIVDMILMSVNK